LGTTLAFEPVYGFIYASLGVLFAASLTYGAGRLLGGAAIQRLSGPRLTKLAGELRANAFRASIAARLLPVGHFTVINMLAGSLRIPFLRFFLGSMVGAVPGVAVTALFADRLWHALHSRAARDVIFLVGAVALVVALSFAARWALRRRSRAGADEQPGA
jgi:phospholipase D1/2